ncbi:uncharacterized protein LOC120645557 [Panicum virgatum]|uniref:uncharacterized protein LOC120645557 n=1 Tax=Panicum virgatum TaxID=38727 RepID=UPI0019D5F3B3|nr:uncharacterized protein LOC120645557 [Panicum virgatum]
MGYDMAMLVPLDQAFYGFIPGAGSTLVGRVTLPVTFGTWDNYRTEHTNFKVASFETSYHTILGRPALAKFMAVPNHMYLLMKMPVPKGVLSFYGDIQTSHSCEMENINLSSTLEWSKNMILVAQATKDLPEDQAQIPTKDSVAESQLQPDHQTKAIILKDDEPH